MFKMGNRNSRTNNNENNESLSTQEYEQLTKWGRKYERYLRLKEYKKYEMLYKNGTLFNYIINKDKDLNKIFLKIVKKIANEEGIGCGIKSKKNSLWIKEMKIIEDRVCAIFDSLLK